MDDTEQLKIQNAGQAELIITYARNAENFVKEIEYRKDIILELEGKVGEMEDKIRNLQGGSNG